ncbi:homeobox protein Hox-A13-like [Panicum virgatum]|uniref:Uncharacterized protein n=1 Tax=Panicum virgatum TaxID=38727 RepID=A0A8T0SFU8_PANVG|nr:homeobox protein Hox-A13-like [Panicum virgatum]KAG2595888.1 hypothetical protein PVAP13_5KG118161 [Panicum virgatum]
MKRTRAQQPKIEDPQDAGAAASAGNCNPTKPQRRAKQPRQPKAGAAAKKPSAAAARAAAAAAAANAASAASAAPSPGPESAQTVPDACAAAGEGSRPVDWDLDAGLDAAAWWTWGVDEEKLLGWFPFVEEDFRCAGGRAGDAEVAAFDHDIWSIW